MLNLATSMIITTARDNTSKKAENDQNDKKNKKEDKDESLRSNLT